MYHFLPYLDAVTEQQMSMTGASMFWLDALHNCKLDRSLSLPYDRHRLVDEHRTGRGISVSFDFGQDLSYSFLSHASLNNIIPEHLVLAMYYVFLFKLTNGEKDLCIGRNIDGRYRDELKPIIGVFGNSIPLRCQLSPYWSFHQLIEHVQEIATNSMKYSYFPLRRILDQHSNISNPAFLNTIFVFLSSTTNIINNEVSIGENRLHAMPYPIEINEHEVMSEFDFSFTIEHDLNTNQLSYKIDASLDIFKVETVHMIAQRLHTMSEQLFTFMNDQKLNKSIYEISLLLPNERFLTQSMNNTKTSFSSASCIHHKFVYQAIKYPQKIAVELDDQSLTYSELLQCVQVFSLILSKEYCVRTGDIVCQCVERSLSMVTLCLKLMF